MPSASLGDFPVEVSVQVYKSLDNVTDITASNLTYHQLFNVWHSNTIYISAAVLPRAIESYDDAYELAKT